MTTEAYTRLRKYVASTPCKCRYIGEGVTLRCERCEVLEDTAPAADQPTAAHVHSDECWEPDSGCDMGRNEAHVKAVQPTASLSGFVNATPAEREHVGRRVAARVDEIMNQPSVCRHRWVTDGIHGTQCSRCGVSAADNGTQPSSAHLTMREQGWTGSPGPCRKCGADGLDHFGPDGSICPTDRAADNSEPAP